MNKKQYAFVGPNKRIYRLFETEQNPDKIPSRVTQIHLTEEQHSQVISLRKEGKVAGWENDSVVEFILS